MQGPNRSPLASPASGIDPPARVRAVRPGVEDTARRYAGRLLQLHGLDAAAGAIELIAEHPAEAAARCGLMALTGEADAEPELCPAPIAACADGALAALAAIAPSAALRGLCGSQLLSERAAITGHTRGGAISPNGSCRLLRAADGVLALNLARDDDWSLLPAWLQDEVDADWDALSRVVARRRVAALVEQGRLLGLAVADAGVDVAPPPGRRVATRPGGPAHPAGRPLVVDLSSLWAGPLCSHLLQRCGADVIKLESRQRPDGARGGAAAFFDLMHAGKRSVVLDFGTAPGRAQLAALLARADIVIESSRPRALRQLGITAEQLLAANPRMTWISITGHGRADPQSQWIAYGDDAGVAAGLSSLLHQATGRWLICGDAIADPLAGLHAALAAWAGWLRGGAGIIDLPLVQGVRDCAGFEWPGSLPQRWRDWRLHLRASQYPVLAPQARRADGVAAALGADTEAVLRDLCGGAVAAC